jgi:hypothetical protein
VRRALLLVAVALAGCGDDGGAGSASCGPARREALDPASANHVLAGSTDEPEYRTDPPTSGPHSPGSPRSGVLDEPLTRPEQVGSLEAGGVLLQHRDLTDDELADLSALAADGVAVAPNPDLPERVVATAWLFKQACDAVDIPTLQGFVDDHAGQGPGSDG